MPLIGGPILNDTQFDSIVQRCLHRVCMFSGGYVFKEISLIIWPRKANPWNGSENVRRLQPANNNYYLYYTFNTRCNSNKESSANKIKKLMV